MKLTDLFLDFVDSVETERITQSEQLIYIHLLRRGNVTRFSKWFFFSDRELQERTKLSSDTITKAKNRLKQRGFVSIKTNGKQATQYMILGRAGGRADTGAGDGADKQDTGAECGADTGAECGADTGAECGAEGRDNNRVEYSRVKNSNNPPISPQGESEVDIFFAEFWDMYPKKVSKEYARKMYRRLKPNFDLHQKILSALEKHKASSQWTKDNGQFIPHPSTWLNQRRWEDELPEEQQKKDDTPPPREYLVGSPEWIELQERNQREMEEARRRGLERLEREEREFSRRTGREATSRFPSQRQRNNLRDKGNGIAG